MTFQFAYEGLNLALETLFRGDITYKIALLNNATVTASSSMRDFLAEELRTPDGYTRGTYAPSAAATDLSKPGSRLPTYTHTFTAAGASPLQFDCYVLIANGKAKANALISTIASDTLNSTAHGFVAGDRVFFDSTVSYPTGIDSADPYYVISSGLTADAFKISDTLGGSAIALGTSWSGSLYAMNGTGTPMVIAYREEDGTGDRTMTILSGQSYDLLIDIGGKRDAA